MSIKVNRKIGSGSYGRVYAVEYQKEKYAAKLSHADKDVTGIINIKEVDLLGRLEHPNINRISFALNKSTTNGKKSVLWRKVAARSDKDMRVDQIAILTQLADYDLGDFIYSEDNNRDYNYFRKAKVFMRHILLALHYIHNKYDLIHLDIKPGNIVVFDKNYKKDFGDAKYEPGSVTTKLIDFGLSMFFSYQQYMDTNVITSWYRSPEICLELGNYNHTADIWSTACVFFELITKEPLFSVKSKKKENPAMLSKMLNQYNKLKKSYLFQKIKKKHPKLCRKLDHGLTINEMVMAEMVDELPESFNQSPGNLTDFIDLLSWMLEPDTFRRPSALDCLNHPFFKNHSLEIESTIASYTLTDYRDTFSVHSNTRRAYIFDEVNEIYKNRRDLFWYEHRILFNSLSLYDQFIHYSQNNEVEFENYILKYVNRNRDGYLFVFYSCIYLSMKFFNNIDFSFHKLCPKINFKKALRSGDKKINNKHVHKTYQSLEFNMLMHLFNWRVFFPNVYEVANYFNYRLNSAQIYDLLKYYLSLSSKDDYSARKVFFQFYNEKIKNITM